MRIIFLIIALFQGDIRYKAEELPGWTECRQRKAEVEAWVLAVEAQIIRSECFEVGQVANK